MIPTRVLAMLLALLSLPLGCASAPSSPWESTPDDPNVHEKSVKVLGTHFIVRLWLDPKDHRNVESLFRPAVAEIFRVAKITDSDDPKSEISRLNGMAAAGNTSVSADLTTLLSVSQQLHDRSGGVFDITFAPIQEQVESQGPDAGLNGTDREFSPEGVDKETRLRVGQKNWYLDVAGRKVRYFKRGIKLVVKGVAKGYAAQKAAEKLLPLKIRGFAVIAGNSFVASGLALRDPKLMCVENFDRAGRCQFKVTALNPQKLFFMGMAASTDRPGHNYNPKSGSRTFRTGGAAVIGPDGAWTQGAATAASILDEAAFSDFFKRNQQPALSGIWSGASSDSDHEGTLEPYAKVSTLND